MSGERDENDLDHGLDDSNLDPADAGVLADVDELHVDESDGDESDGDEPGDDELVLRWWNEQHGEQATEVTGEMVAAYRREVVAPQIIALVAEGTERARQRAADRRPRLFDQKCPTCVFRPGNLMNLPPGRLAELVNGNLARGTALVCHLTTYGQRPDLGEVLCRGFVDAHGDQVGSIQVLQRLTNAFGYLSPFEVVPVPHNDRPCATNDHTAPSHLEPR